MNKIVKNTIREKSFTDIICYKIKYSLFQILGSKFQISDITLDVIKDVNIYIFGYETTYIKRKHINKILKTCNVQRDEEYYLLPKKDYKHYTPEGEII